MPPQPRATRNELHRWRLIALGAAVAAIVLVPYLFAKRSIEDALVASEVVALTAQVKADAIEIAFLVRDVEAAALALAGGMQGGNFRERITEGLKQLPARIEALKRLVAENPDQLVRLGQLQARLDARRLLTEEAVLEVDTGRLPEARAALRRAADQYHIRELVTEIAAVEEARLQERQHLAQDRRSAATWLALAAALAQLLLLGAVLWISEHQVVQRIAAERDARHAVSRAQAIFQSVREPIVLLDRELRVVMHNSAFTDLYGMPAAGSGPAPRLAEVGGGEWNDAVLMQRLGDVASRDRELWDHEIQQRPAEGPERILMVNARRMRLPDRDDSVVLMTVADLTAHKRAEQQVRELARQLEGKVEQISEVNRELEAFSYSVSHDLRAPLRHIAGFADKLERHLGERADDRTRHYLEVIGGSAARMAGLIDDLLVYSRLGRNALRLQPVDMQSIAEEVRQMLSADLGERRVRWQIQPLPIVVADENMMRQVWQNLLGNALKYTARRELTEIEVTARSQDDGSIRFSVRDNGAGFDMAYAGKLFGVFQRLHKAGDFPGSGIGLANVRRILARHGGRIWAEAAPDQGATFHFTLPAQPGTASDTGLRA